MSFLLLASLAIGQTSPADAMNDDLKRLEGTWRVVAIESNGQAIPAELIEQRNETYTFRGETSVMRTDKPEEHPGTIKLDPSRTPRTIDLMPTENKALANVGIYDVQGDRLTLCLSRDRKERPTAFRAGPGSNAILILCKRQNTPAPPLAVWRQVSAVVDGKEIPVGKATLLSVAGETYSVTVDGRTYQRGRVKVIPGEGPRRSEVTVVEGPNAGRTIGQISKVEGDTMTACSSKPGDPSPTDFTSTPGSGRTLSTWARVK